MVMIMGGAPLRYPTTHLATPALVGEGQVLHRLAIPVRTSRTVNIAHLAVDQRGLQVLYYKSLC